ncbi:DUF4286 family protein [Conexibacter sp. CPCC 206217]|uniref:DUF4286 family protein n=1 Tax=Conexibacter sp. CPCC 206217 TaxID=3064574 RepID=UPI0027219E0A|nr:DUF4286 family protein [Conexibacter sp. CPCC 206217]MDO8209572.1 hypothetical protein [Conexibacter sp. CPCC 206217]
MALIHLSLLDVDPAYAESFEQWYRGEHLPRALAQSGAVRALVYGSATGSPDHLTIHELAPGTQAGAELALQLTPFREESIGRRIRNYDAETFRLCDRAGEHDETPALLNVITTEVAPEHAVSFDAWYSNVHVPEILGCPGWRSARRFASADAAARFLAIYELEDERLPFHSPEYDAAVGWDEQVGNLRGYHGFRVYRLSYTVLGAAASRLPAGAPE